MTTLTAGADDIREMTDDVSDSAYYNPDIAATPRSRRKWGTGDIAALWISMCACIPTYMLASSLIAEGMNWWQAVLTITLGNTIVLIPMILNAHAGTRYGISFPVYCRASFGIAQRGLSRRCSGAYGGLRLVWHSNLYRRRGDLQDRVGFLPVANDLARYVLEDQSRAVRLFHAFLGDQYVCHL